MRSAPLVIVAVALGGCGERSAPVTGPPPAPAPPAAARPAPRVLPAASAQRAELARLRRADRPVYCGGDRRRLVALTFDDGPGPYTRLALKELRAAHAHATFFLVGRSFRAFPRRPLEEKHVGALGDHTATHAFLPALTAGAMRRQLAAGQHAAQHAAGIAVRLFRPPYGSFTPAVTAAARHLGMVEVLWSVDSGDSLSGDFHVLAARMRRAIRPGAIVLMHENRGQTIRALRSILPWLRRHRLRAVSVPELLAADPPSRAQLRAGEAGCPAVTSGPARRSSRSRR